MKPPKELNVIDQHGGFTAVTKSPTYVKIVVDPVEGERIERPEDYRPTLVHPFVRWQKVWRERDTVWRPGELLKNPVGVLDEVNEKSFYQTNDDVTKALYKVEGYRYRIATWWDNKTGERIA